MSKLTTSPRSSVSYRFAHETNETFQLLEFDADKISTSDLKVLIAKATGLEKEFGRRFDLKLSLYTPDKPGAESGQVRATSQDETLSTEKQFVYPGAKILVQRVAWHERPSIQHVASTELVEEPPSKKRPLKRMFPPEFICPICLSILHQPVVVRCHSKCGQSVCRRCIELRFKETHTCPSCQGPVRNVISNKALMAVMSQLDLEEFDDVPQRQEAVKLQPQEQQRGSSVKLEQPVDVFPLNPPHQQASIMSNQGQPPKSSSEDSHASTGAARSSMDHVSDTRCTTSIDGFAFANDPRPPMGEQVGQTQVKTEVVDAIVESSSSCTSDATGFAVETSSTTVTLLSNPLLKHLAAVLSSTKRVAPFKLIESTSPTAQQSARSVTATPPLGSVTSSVAPSSHFSDPPRVAQVSDPVKARMPLVTRPPPFPHLTSSPPRPSFQPNPPDGLQKAGVHRPRLVSPIRPSRVSGRASVHPVAVQHPVPVSVPFRPPLTLPPGGSRSQRPADISTQYVFDPTMNSWKQVARRDSDVLHASPRGGRALPPYPHCPFTSINELASQFPILSKKDFTIIREFQRQFQLALDAQQAVEEDTVARRTMSPTVPLASHLHSGHSAMGIPDGSHCYSQKDLTIRLQRQQQQHQRLMLVREQRLRQ